MWNRWVLLGFGFGLGVATVVGGILWYSQRPKPWNTKALVATYLYADTRSDDHIYVAYVVENTTSEDYFINQPSDVTVMANLSKEKGMTGGTGDELLIDCPVFIPAKQRVIVTLNMKSYKYPENRDSVVPDKTDVRASRQEVARHILTKMRNFGGFTMFDRVTRYQVYLPRPDKTQETTDLPEH